MALEINELKREPEGGMYVSPERIYVTADGELVGEGDVRAVRLVVAKGCEIPAAEAAEYGLISEPKGRKRGTTAEELAEAGPHGDGFPESGGEQATSEGDQAGAADTATKTPAKRRGIHRGK